MTPKTKPKKPAVTIDGKRIELTPDVVDIQTLRLDPDNPRIRYLVKSHGMTNPTQDELKALLWEIGGVQDLMKKIRNNKGAIDPILVKGDGTVVEGNCRLACYRQLSGAPHGAPWKTIEIQRLPKITQLEIDILLSKYHVSGKISWRSYAQAGQIHKLKHDHKMSIEDITNKTGIPDKDVQDLLRTYEIMTEKVLSTLPGKKGLKKFSHIYEFVKNADPDLKEWRKDEKNVEEFVKWVAEGKIKKGADVRNLPKILKSSTALKTLRGEKDGGKKAFGMVVRAREFGTLEDALNVLENMKSALIDVLKADKKEQKVVKQLHIKIQAVAELAGVKLD